MFLYSFGAFILGFALDLILGDPQGWPHIIRAYGWIIARFERLLWPMRNKRRAGAVTIILVLLTCAVLPGAALFAISRAVPPLYAALEALLVWQLLAVKSLRSESLLVYTALASGNLVTARRAASMIVGRDTQSVDEEGIARAAVETVAENTADGIAAPILAIALFGSLGGMLVKAVSTMDSAIGYKNERYIDFGSAAAHLDDAVMHIPARLCARMMILAARLCGFDSGSAARIYLRDRFNHASPNSAHTEAVMAGALGLRLAGPASYFGVMNDKPYIGDPERKIEAEDILRANRLSLVTALLMFALGAVIRCGVTLVVL
ncbi:MAG: adenosylcobinamide-phosphate synthase CbiB [Oscillospiraceae bacterium]|nr:adenosylcobinamide-phosphate synthase CbiB [Oscillospiraceae bacterium]